MRPIHISEALRMFKRAGYVRQYGFKQYKGSPKQIAKQIIDDCWNKKHKYFMVSSGHFNEFYCRDFGMCAEALVKLGYKNKVHQTIDYALKKFQKNKRITTSISPKGKCFDFPNYGADSLPFIIHAIRVSNAKNILKKYNVFIKHEIDFYRKNVFDNKTSLIRSDKHFSSIKDYAKRSSSCYSNCMLAMLSDDLKALKFYNPFSSYDIKKSIIHHFWNGSYFYDDTSKTKVITGDANTFPFWCNIISSKHIFNLCMKSMEKAKLTKPFPLKYTTKPEKIHKMHFLEIFAGDYERDTIWMHLGLCFLDITKRFDKKRFKKHIKQYDNLIKEDKNFLEIYDKNGFPFNNPFYISDESMLWVSKYLALKK
jgi:hypothetical protein